MNLDTMSKSAILCYMELIEKLERYRLENKLSQEKLAEKLDVHYSTVNRWLQGHRRPNKIQEYHIKKLLGIKR